MATTPVSPKVTAGTATAAIVGLLLQTAQGITPDSFAFLGKYQGLAFLIVTLAAGAAAAYKKADPLRGQGQNAPLVPASAPFPAARPGIVPGSTVDQKTAAVLDHTVPVVTAPADPATVEAPAPATDPTTPAA